jgi:hypothetical protein
MVALVGSIGLQDNGTLKIIPATALPVISVTATDSSATELGTTTGQFTITSDVAAGASGISVAFIVSGTAALTSDYTINASPAIITQGNTSVVVTVTPVDDSDIEGAETVILTLANGIEYNLGSNVVDTVTITDDDTSNNIIAIRIVTDQVNGGVAANWLEFIVEDLAGNNLFNNAQGGTFFQSSAQLGSTQADKAFDDNITGDLYAGSAVGQQIGWTIGRVLPALRPNNIVRYKLVSRSHPSTNSTTPISWHVEVSSNSDTLGVGVWELLHTVTNEPAWSGNETRTFTL